MMRQCEMRKSSHNGNTHLVSWIPEKFAEIGRYIKLKNNGVWTDGHEVIAIGYRGRSEEVIKRSMDYKSQREASDL